MKLPKVLHVVTHTHRFALIALMALIMFEATISMVSAANESASSADAFTTQESGPQAYSVTVTALEKHQRQLVSSGRRMIRDLWVLPTDYNGIWGVGPTFNEASCLTCHKHNGRAKAPDHAEEVANGLLVRLSIPGESDNGAPRPHPNYGDQFQNRGVRGQVPAEGKVIVKYETVIVDFPDGEQIKLRKPSLEFTRLYFGELGDETMLSSRIAPSLIGLGLLEAIPEETVLAIAREQPKQGLNGQPNYVWNHTTGKMVLGRFGWKANQPDLLQQTAAAFHGDIGATSSIFPVENCPAAQAECITGPTATGCSGGHVVCAEKMNWEVLPSRLRNVTRYLQAIAVPAQRNADDSTVKHGRELFVQAQCSGCHVPELKTGNTAEIVAAANLTIAPFTDLLLHDMGEGLADHRPDFKANGRQWRTPPLWGLGLQETVNGHTDLLHDGRARNFVEAIVWHGGEAQSSRDRFMNMPKPDRDAVVKFLESL